MNRIKLLKILELDGNATEDDIEHAYKELIKVWHPDRFQNDPVLRVKSEERTRQINMAFQQLSKGRYKYESSKAENVAKDTKFPSAPRFNYNFLILFLIVFLLSFIYFKYFDAKNNTFKIDEKTYLTLKKEILISAKRKGEIKFEEGEKSIKSPFIKAITECEQTKVESMIVAGSSVNESDAYGNSALSWAVRQGCKNIVQSLLAKGANVNQKSNNGFSPLMWASLYNREEIQKILIDAGSEPLPKYWDRDY